MSSMDCEEQQLEAEEHPLPFPTVTPWLEIMRRAVQPIVGGKWRGPCLETGARIRAEQLAWL